MHEDAGNDYVTEALTGSFENVPSTHDGTPFTVDIDFTHDVEISYRDFDDAWTVTGGTITAASRINGERDRWRITVNPSGNADVELTLPATTASACSQATTVCAAGDNPLYEDLEATVEREATTTTTPSTLTASFSSIPTNHANATFNADIQFSDDVAISYRYFDDAWTITNGVITGARRIGGAKDHWRLSVLPSYNSAVQLTLPAANGCSSNTSVCTADGDALSAPLSATINP